MMFLGWTKRGPHSWVDSTWGRCLFLELPPAWLAFKGNQKKTHRVSIVLSWQKVSFCWDDAFRTCELIQGAILEKPQIGFLVGTLKILPEEGSGSFDPLRHLVNRRILCSKGPFGHHLPCWRSRRISGVLHQAPTAAGAETPGPSLSLLGVRTSSRAHARMVVDTCSWGQRLFAG